MSKPIKQLQLSEVECTYLEALISSGTIEARVYRRAKILLLKAEGMSFDSIAEKLDVTISTMQLCVVKYLESGVVAALKDASGQGRKQEIFDDSKAWGVNIAWEAHCLWTVSGTVVPCPPHQIYQLCGSRAGSSAHGDRL